MLIIVMLQYCYDNIAFYHCPLIFSAYISIQEEFTKFLPEILFPSLKGIFINISLIFLHVDIIRFILLSLWSIFLVLSRSKSTYNTMIIIVITDIY